MCAQYRWQAGRMLTCSLSAMLCLMRAAEAPSSPSSHQSKRTVQLSGPLGSTMLVSIHGPYLLIMRLGYRKA